VIRSGVVGKTGIIRLRGPALAALRRSRFVMDHWKCVDCGATVSWASGHLAHVLSLGAGGSDTLENTRAKCGDCHLVGEHNPKSVRRAQ